jgi:hypothetical protein
MIFEYGKSTYSIILYSFLYNDNLLTYVYLPDYMLTCIAFEDILSGLWIRMVNPEPRFGSRGYRMKNMCFLAVFSAGPGFNCIVDLRFGLGIRIPDPDPGSKNEKCTFYCFFHFDN